MATALHAAAIHASRGLARGGVLSPAVLRLPRPRGSWRSLRHDQPDGDRRQRRRRDDLQVGNLQEEAGDHRQQATQDDRPGRCREPRPCSTCAGGNEAQHIAMRSALSALNIRSMTPISATAPAKWRPVVGSKTLCALPFYSHSLPMTASTCSRGAEETRKMPEYGLLNSRIRKAALATPRAPMATATKGVAPPPDINP